MSAGVLRGRELEGDLSLACQVCVVGTGAGGAAAAARLAVAGHDVVAVEAGGYHAAADFDQRELAMLEAMYAEDGRRATSDLAIPVLCGRSVGGSTTHNTGYVYRAPPAILDRWRREAGVDWSEDDAARLYHEAATDIGVTDAQPSDLNRNNALVLDGARALGWRARRTAHNRSGGCSGCGYCMLGCAYNRKQSALVTYVPRFLAAGGRLVADAPALRIRRDRGAWRVDGIFRRADKSPSGHRYAISAQRVVVAAGAIDTPALLERSGLGGPARGRRLRLHPAAAVAARFDEPVVAWRGVPQMAMVEEFASFFDDGYGGYLLMPVSATPALLAPLVPGIGFAHRSAMAELPHVAFGCALVHDETAGRVRDRAGPGLRPRIDYWPDRADTATLLRGIADLARLYFAAGARECRLPLEGSPPARDPTEVDRILARCNPAPHRLLLQSVHPQGSCPMGANPRTCVARPDQELHDAPGIHLADTSLFPCSLGVPPQLTAMALGLRAAERIGAASAR